MFEESDKKYLLRVLSKNQVVLFLGAGFSSSARNSLGSTLPLGKALASDLWDFLDYPDKYDDTPLPDMYEATLASGKKSNEIKKFIEDRLICDDIPEIYDSLTKAYWYRIYTTNVDNLPEVVYKRASHTSLSAISYPRSEPCERDQTLSAIQSIYLHGKLPCNPNELTFSVRQYAHRSNTMDPLYEQFVRDYSTHPTIFIGTQLNEPLFWQYIEARESRRSGISENRPKSFLVAPRISPPKRTQLKSYNIIPIEGSSADFLAWLDEVSRELPSRIEILRAIVPDIAHAIEAPLENEYERTALTLFSQFFHRVQFENKKPNVRSLFLLGASPQWEDILSDLDAPRTITDTLIESVSSHIEQNRQLKIIALLGSAGCGKSTVLRRAGLNLSRSGRIVYLTNSEELPKPSDLATALCTLPSRAILLFDNAEIALSVLSSMCDSLKVIDKPPIIIIASRTNDFDRRIGKVSNDIAIQEIHIPRLNKGEIIEVLKKLDENNLLGRLQGMNEKQRIYEFETRANKQILVAMREATSGRGFDIIIEDEFKTLESYETKVLYLCVALATEAGYRIKKSEFLGCSKVTPAESLHLLSRNLRDIVIPSGPESELLLLRHRTIAEFAIDAFAPRSILRDAYIRLLKVLSRDAIGKHWRSRSFGFYRDLINHFTIYKRFESNINEARTIYDALKNDLKQDAQYWLQYGSLELEGDNLEYAENYLNAADSLDSNNTYIQNAMGHLLIKKGIAASTYTEALTLRDSGSEILQNSILYGRENDAHCYHIYCSQRHKWMHKWTASQPETVAELEHLRSTLKDATKLFSRNRQLQQLHDMIESEYLSLAINNRH